MHNLLYKSYPSYSVLMSVYYKDNAIWLKMAIDSILNQTILPDQFVLICDGPLSETLEKVISQYVNHTTISFEILRLEENQGLGAALNKGLSVCRNEIILRMDSDDISLPNRAENELAIFLNNSDISLLSSTVLEFTDNSQTTYSDFLLMPPKITGARTLPIAHEDILRYSKRRNPFNHPSIAFKKSAIIDSGSYREDYHLFEDYDLWIRVLQKGYKTSNIKTPLLYMRTPFDIYKRRGGFRYALNLLRFHFHLLRTHWTSTYDYFFAAIPHAILCISPIFLRKFIYHRIHKSV